jgi:peptidoglycan/LPS O-acetylase OafA/YrhL
MKLLSAHAHDPIKYKQGRIFELDLLRGIAIILVCYRHTVLRPYCLGAIAPIPGLLYQFGGSGVDLFFVLSGFLIGNLLFKEYIRTSTINVGRFITRRGLKIWPSYYFYLGLNFLVLLIVSGNFKNSLSVFVPSLLFLQNYFYDFSFYFLKSLNGSHTWSLCVEEHFYLLLPLLLTIFLSRLHFDKNKSLLPIIFAAVAIACFTLRWMEAFSRTEFSSLQLEMTHFRLDSLFFGVFIAYLFNFCPKQWSWLAKLGPKLLFLGLLLIAPMAFISVFRNTAQMRFFCTFGFTMYYLGYGCILVYLLNLPKAIKDIIEEHKLTRFITFIGFYSYSIYLWHLTVALPGRDFCEPIFVYSKLNPILTPFVYLLVNLVYLLIVVFIGVFAARLIEQPFLAIREVLFPPETKLAKP